MVHSPQLDMDLLLLKVAQGNENAFGQLFKVYKKRLNGYIMGITKSGQLTEEMVQDVFLKIWINRSSLSQIDSFNSYLFVIAKNHTLDCLKQINRKKKQEKEWAKTMINCVSVSLPEPINDNSQEQISKAVSSLPCQQKKIYLLRNSGMKQIEIARRLNISIETVKKHSMLAKRSLRKRLTGSAALI